MSGLTITTLGLNLIAFAINSVPSFITSTSCLSLVSADLISCTTALSLSQTITTLVLCILKLFKNDNLNIESLTSTKSKEGCQSKMDQLTKIVRRSAHYRSHA